MLQQVFAGTAFFAARRLFWKSGAAEYRNVWKKTHADVCLFRKNTCVRQANMIKY